jgi:hypothetical protein
MEGTLKKDLTGRPARAFSGFRPRALEEIAVAAGLPGVLQPGNFLRTNTSADLLSPAELSARGLLAGSIGASCPGGDFDTPDILGRMAEGSP